MKRLRNVLVIAGVLTILSAMAHWGGTARPGPLFVIGTIVLLGLVSAFGLLVWWLYFSPLPEIEKLPRSHVPVLYQITALLTLICSTLFVTGGIWDAVEHRRLGGFGDDFLWPPHMLIYSGLALTALFAIVGLLIALRGRGDIRARFRAAPLPGLIGLLAGYLILSAPSDQIWHNIYGPDVTSWSLPHLILLLGNIGVFLSGMAIQLALIPQRSWQCSYTFDWRELIAVLLISLVCIVLTLAGTTEWEGIIRFGERAGRNQNAAFSSVFWARPEWLYPVIITTIGLFVGNIILHTLKRPGAATLVGLLTLSYRVIVLSAFGGWSPEISFSARSHLLLLPALIVLDLWYAVRISQADTLTMLTLGNLFAGTGCLLVGLPLINALMVYPRINATTIPAMIGFGLLMALVAGWAGARLGAWLGAIGQFDATVAQSVRHVEPSLVS